MTVDAVTGKLFVSDLSRTLSFLLRFPPDSNGNVAPFARSAGTPAYYIQMASDSSGKNVIVAHGAPCCTASLVGTYTLAKQFYNGGDQNVVYRTEGVLANGLIDDPTTKTYLITGSVPKPNGFYHGI